MPLLGWRGNVFSFALDPVSYIQRLRRRYGDIAAVTRGSARHIFVFTPAYNRQILGDPQLFEVVEAPLDFPPGSSLARIMTIPGQMNGKENGRQRQNMYAAMGRKMHARYWRGLTELTAAWLNKRRVGETFDLFYELNQLATSVPCQSIFGLDPAGDGREIVHWLHEWGDALLAFSTRLFPFDIPRSSYRRLLRASERLEAAYRELIAQRRAKGPTSGDTLDFLINLRDSEPERLNDDQLLGLINNFFNAGNSSRATIISWAIFLLSQHPHYLQEMEAELARTLNGRPPEINELERLPLLRGALQESMRLLPPMNWFPRRTSAPAQLGPYAIPAGSMVICSPFITHRLPEIFPQPDRFMPDRWTAKLSPYDYMPFGAGPRICPGRDLAMLEMMTVLAMILQRYRLTPPPHARIDRAGMMLSAPRRMPVVVQRPDGPYAARSCRGNINRWIDFGGREEK